MEYRCVQSVFLAWSIICLIPAAFTRVKSLDHPDVRIEVSKLKSALAGDVNITFWFPPQLSANRTKRVVTVHVYHCETARKLVFTTSKQLTDAISQVVVLPCVIFHQPGEYQFQYNVSDSEIRGTLNQTLVLKWSNIRIVTPMNHTALTRFGSIWIYHNRKCLPPTRDKIFLYYTRDNERVNITSKIVRKLQNGPQKEGETRIRMSFHCELFDTQGIYHFEYISMFKDHPIILSRSKGMHVTWSAYSLESPLKSIFPCKYSFLVHFTAPKCQRSTDIIQLYKQNSDKVLEQKSALATLNTASYPCALFFGYVKGYCFKYITKAFFTKKETVQATLCLPALRPGVKSLDHPDVRIEVSKLKSALAGDVNITFWFPPQLSANRAKRVVIVHVYHCETVRKRVFTTSKQLTDAISQVVVLPCVIFHQPGEYQFQYNVSDSEIRGTLNQTLVLKWSNIRIVTPMNHTALTRFGSIYIYHNRKCLPPTRDKIFLYYTRDKERVNITSKVVRKLQNGQQKEGETRIRMSFHCELFDTQGFYHFEYISMFKDHPIILSRSKSIHVTWGAYSLESPLKSIFPCKYSFLVHFTAPKCQRSTDIIQLYKQNSDKVLEQKSALATLNTASYPCALFFGYVKGYCFKYITKAFFTKKETVQATLCLPALRPGLDVYGWSTWTNWNICHETCGKGKQFRYRFCLSTSQDKQDSACQGEKVQKRDCYVKPCPGTTDSCSCGCIMRSSEAMITSSPKLFPTLGVSSCKWRINVEDHLRIKLWFYVLKLDGDWIRVHDGNDSNARELAYITNNGHESTIISSSNVMYINYHHNGKWNNETERGFTASYTTMGKLPISSKSFSEGKLSFLGVFVMAVVLMGVVLLVVFKKLHRQHKLAGQRTSPHPAGSTSTSESTLRSAGTSSPQDDEASGNEPLRNHKHFETKRHKRKRHRSSRGKEYVYDSKLPRCSCAELSELESFSVTYSAHSSADLSNYSVNDNISLKRVSEESIPDEIIVECNCPKCFARERQKYAVHENFGAPEKKYYGDWMVVEQNSQADKNWRHSYPRYV